MRNAQVALPCSDIKCITAAIGPSRTSCGRGLRSRRQSAAAGPLFGGPCRAGPAVDLRWTARPSETADSKIRQKRLGAGARSTEPPRAPVLAWSRELQGTHGRSQARPRCGLAAACASRGKGPSAPVAACNRRRLIFLRLACRRRTRLDPALSLCTAMS